MPISPEDLGKLFEQHLVRWRAQVRGNKADWDDAIQDVAVALLEGLEPPEGHTYEDFFEGTGRQPSLVKQFVSTRKRRERWQRASTARSARAVSTPGTLQVQFPEADGDEDPQPVLHYPMKGVLHASQPEPVRIVRLYEPIQITDLPTSHTPPAHEMRVDVQRAVEEVREACSVDPVLVWKAWGMEEHIRDLAQQRGRDKVVIQRHLERARVFLLERLAPYKGDRKPRLHGKKVTR